MLELYPYAVPSRNYTPYRTLAHIPGMGLRYYAWENKHKHKSIGYPDRHRLLGGLGDVPPDQRQAIIDATTVPTHFCCEDPYWLYKIYQDTEVTVPEVLALLSQPPAAD